MRGREQGLTSIAVVDFFSGDIVLRTLVRPDGTVTDWRREYTGLTKDRMQEAIKKRKVLSGWREAREKIFNVSTCETIFIGHALGNDLRVLRIATNRVVDSMMMMSRAVFGDISKFPRNWGLKNASRELLGVDVQKPRTPHNALEDALATRELVLQWGPESGEVDRMGGAHARETSKTVAQAKGQRPEVGLERREHNGPMGAVERRTGASVSRDASAVGITTSDTSRTQSLSAFMPDEDRHRENRKVGLQVMIEHAALWNEAQQQPEWATTQLWEHIFNRIVFNTHPWIVSSQQPPTRQDGDLRRVNLVVKRVTSGITLTLLFMEAKRGYASPSDVALVEMQAYTAACAYAVEMNSVNPIWAMTCVGSQARL
ncbi:hypothetical protein CIB48_g1330 [Xylaria polymorpha]|nr:hypothetical protein CIB48_g1330 [Xylaria polymorpha]